jgi:hypothetical protein
MSTNKIETLDQQLFTSEQWRPDQGLNAQYKDVTLKVQVGDFPAGSKFPFAVLIGDASVLVLVDDKQEEHGFRLGLSVGEKVDPSELQCQDEGCTHHH